MAISHVPAHGLHIDERDLDLRTVDILLVEDNPADIRLTREALHDARIANRLHTVVDGEQALAFLRRVPPFENVPRPGLVLLDLNLPRIDGREVLAQIKGDPELHSIPVIVLTTSKAEGDVLLSYDRHANCYVTKPVDFAEFVAALQSLESFWLAVVTLPSA